MHAQWLVAIFENLICAMLLFFCNFETVLCCVLFCSAERLLEIFELTRRNTYFVALSTHPDPAADFVVVAASDSRDAFFRR